IQTRSGTFWAFWRLITNLRDAGRGPPIIVLENVYGILTAKAGRDFAAIGECLTLAGYTFGALLVDAIHFLPQSRPRVFIVAVQADVVVPGQLLAAEPQPTWHPRALVGAYEGMSAKAKAAWRWWSLPRPQEKRRSLESIIAPEPLGVEWHSVAET